MADSTSDYLTELFRLGLQQLGRGEGDTGRTPGKSASDIRMQHRMMYWQMQMQKSTSYGIIRSNYSHKVHSSSSPLSALSKVSIKELHMDKVATGKYLILRTIEVAFKMAAILTVVEDHVGNVRLFSVYNFHSTVDASPEEVFPIGTVLILKEPYFKVPASGGPCILRCDCPSNIIILRVSHPLFDLVEDIDWKNELAIQNSNPVLALPIPKGPAKWKSRGNELYKAGKTSYALDCYLLALREADKLSGNKGLCDVLHLNSAACYLLLDNFELALTAATKVLESQPDNMKGLLRAAKALYGLRQYKEATVYYEKLNGLYPENTEAKTGWMKAKERVSEAEGGSPNVYKLCLERALRPQQKIECGDFIGPVEVFTLPGNSRVVATRDIEPGTVLCISKALQVAWTKLQDFSMQSNSDRSVDHGSNMDVVAALAETVMKNPRTFGPVVYGLPLGEAGILRSDLPKVFCDPETREEPIADIAAIKQIVHVNCFSLNSLGFGGTCWESQVLTVAEDCGSGLFSVPSYFNHSCLPNAHWEVFNDVMLIRSTKFIKKGEEVYIMYFPVSFERWQKEQVLKTRGFECECPQCMVLQREPPAFKNERGRMMAYFKDTFRPHFTPDLRKVPRKVLDGLERTVAGLEALCVKPSEQKFFQMEMLEIYVLLWKSYCLHKRYEQAVQTALKVISVFGYDAADLLHFGEDSKNWSLLSSGFMQQELLFAIVMLVVAYSSAGRRTEMQKWSKVLIALEEVLSGGDVKVVRLKYPKIKNII